MIRAALGLAQQAGAVVQRADITPVDLIRVGLEMVVAQHVQALQLGVDLELGGHGNINDFLAGSVGVAGGHQSLNTVTAANGDFGRDKAILKQRARSKPKAPLATPPARCIMKPSR